MTITAERGQDVLTPTVRQGAKRAAFWIVAGVVLVLLALGIIATTGAGADLPPLDPESAAPDGSRAVVQVLEQNGVTVIPTASLAATEQALDGTDDATLLVYDTGLLAGDQVDALLSLSDRIVLVDPGFDLLDAGAPGVVAAGSPDDDPLEAACDLPAARAAGTVSPLAVGDSGPGSAPSTTYRVTGGGDAELCLRSDSDGADPAYSLVQVETSGRTVSVLGAYGALQNGTVLQQGGAALALTLLGERPELVWYLPSVADQLGEGDPGLLTPGWVTPAIALAVLVFLAAAFWRGRRFGPLIVENLPVVVRASETMEGRARLYQKSSSRLRALDALRLGAIGRLARLVGLTSAATVDEVVTAVASALGTDVRDIRSLLVDDDPRTDSDLVRLSDALLDLERTTAQAVRP